MQKKRPPGSFIFCLTLLPLLAPEVFSADPTGGGYTLISLVGNLGGSMTPSTSTVANLSLRSSLPVNAGVNPQAGSGYSFSSGFIGQSLVKFAALGIASAHAYPVPWRKSQHGGSPIIFTDLTSDVRVKIYTLAGKLVRELGKSGPGSELFWDLRNAQGQEVFSGVYFFVVTDSIGGEKRKGKLMIIR